MYSEFRTETATVLVESVWDAGYHDVVVFGNYEKADKTITSRDELFIKFIESGLLDEQRDFYFTKEMKVDRNKKGSTPIMLMDSVADLFTFPNDSQKALKSASVRNPPPKKRTQAFPPSFSEALPGGRLYATALPEQPVGP